MTRQEYAELWQLRTRWLGVYHVALVHGVWRAKRYHAVADGLSANTVAKLAEQIRHDYAGLAGGHAASQGADVPGEAPRPDAPNRLTW